VSRGEWLVDRRLGEWTVEAFLAEGGMSTVWRVKNARDGSPGAMKVPLGRDPDLLARAAREGRIQATIQHPNMLRCLDIVDVDGRPGVVLELVEGGETLDNRLRAGALPPEEAERIFLGVLDGIEAAHARGYIHRDIKPSNVLLGADGVPRVADFGLGRPEHELPTEKLTRQGYILGSAAYMAPEQARDAGSVNAKADLWSLGCLLYELLSRVPAFPGHRVDEVLAAVMQGRYRPLDAVLPGVDGRFVVAVDACLSVDPRARVDDVATLRRILARQQRWVSGGGRAHGPAGIASREEAAADRARRAPVPTNTTFVSEPPPAGRGFSTASLGIAGVLLLLGALWLALG